MFAVASGVSGLVSDFWCLDVLISTTFLIALLGFVVFSYVVLKSRKVINLKGWR